MAVHTCLSTSKIRRYLKWYEIGDLISARGIAAGTVNTMYDIRTTIGHYVLRILEDRSTRDATFESAVLSHLRTRGLSVPRMLNAGRRGPVVTIAPRQHLSVFDYLPGRELVASDLGANQCWQVGEFVARLHLATRDLRRNRRNPFGPARVRKMLEHATSRVRSQSQHRVVSLLLREVHRHAGADDELPTGTIHGDMFLDNLRFLRGKLVAVLDFEMASRGPFVYDVAVAMDSLSFTGNRFVSPHARALLAGYESQRPLERVERNRLFDSCCFAAARFAAERFSEFELGGRPGVVRVFKDYREFVGRLAFLRRTGRQSFRARLFD